MRDNSATWHLGPPLRVDFLIPIMGIYGNPKGLRVQGPS